MKVFFIIPPSIHYIEPYAYVEADKSNVSRAPLGVLYVAAELRRSLQVEVRIIDLNIGDITIEDLDSLLEAEKPDVVGFSVLSFNLLNCMEVSKVVRRVSPNTLICFGGWHPSLYPEETLGLGIVDYIVIGEGERTFVELISVLLQKKAITDQLLIGIKGIGFRKSDGSIQITDRRDPIRNMDELPFPAYDLIDTKRYAHLLATSDHVVSIMTSRGCPLKCIFCDLRGTPYRFRSPANVVAEIRQYYANGVREFFIQDDNFTLSKKRAVEFCSLIVESGMKIKYKISSRVDSLDEELLLALKRSGCYRIYLGVESGSQAMLDYLEKGITIDQIREAFRIANLHGIDCCAYIMIGIPGEGEREIDATMRLVNDIGARHLQCSICTPMPMTRLYLNLIETGIITEDYWRSFAKNPDPSFRTRFASDRYSGAELRNMQNKIQRRFYWRPRMIVKEIFETHGLRGFIAKARLALKMLNA